ncbi:MAG TPA: hypothetical protein VFX59_24810 [Polyangiales bacterium]|nr:hypothetical protein [Polyangiales bacterium]
MRCWLAIVLFCVGCNTHVFSPPAGNFPIESAATIGANRNSVGVEASVAGAVFGPALAHYRVTYRRGLGEQLELSAAPTILVVTDRSRGDSHAGIYALRSQLKYAPVKYVSPALGLGVGASAGGAFVSPDLGVTIAGENPYLIPFATVRGFVSAPIAARRVHFTTADGEGPGDDPDEERDSYSMRPHLSYGYQLSVGLRVPLYHEVAAAIRPALACAVGGSFLYDRTNQGGYLGGGCGLDVGF